MEFLSHILTARWNTITKRTLLLYFWPTVGFLNEGFFWCWKIGSKILLKHWEDVSSHVEIQKSPLVKVYHTIWPGVCLPQKYCCMFWKYERNSSQCSCSICHEGIIFVLQHRQAPAVQEGIKTIKYSSVLPCQSTKSCLLTKSIHLMYPLPRNRRYWGFSRARKASAICNYMNW